MSEKKEREEAEEALLKMIEDIVGKVKWEMDKERKDREASEEQLLNLLEETCNRLNMATRL